MVKTGLFVTLVLNCCFLESVKRDEIKNGVIIRGFDYNPTVHPAFFTSSKLIKFADG
jgi:hypothetical protein